MRRGGCRLGDPRVWINENVGGNRKRIEVGGTSRLRETSGPEEIRVRDAEDRRVRLSASMSRRKHPSSWVPPGRVEMAAVRRYPINPRFQKSMLSPR